MDVNINMTLGSPRF